MLECKRSFNDARDPTDSLAMTHVGFDGAKYDGEPGSGAKNGRQSFDLNWITYRCTSPMSLDDCQFKSVIRVHSFQAESVCASGLLHVFRDDQSAYLYIICFIYRQFCFNVRSSYTR